MNNRYSDEIIMDLLPLYIEGMVSEETARVIKERLGESPECMEVYEHMSAEIKLDGPRRAHVKPQKKKISPLLLILIIYAVLMTLVWALILLDQLFFYR